MRWPPRHLGWEPYLHLLWLSYLVLQPIFDPAAGFFDWLLIGGMLAAFLPLYFWTYTHERRGDRRGLWGVAGMALLGTVFAPLNSGSSSFFIYAAAAVGYILPPKAAVRWLAGLVGLVLVSALLSPVPWPYVLTAFLFPGIMTLVIGGLNVFYAEKAQADAQLRLAHSEIRRLATVAERERIARDLHDLLGHTLSSITLKSELAAKLAQADPARAGLEMREVTRVSRDALREVREAVRGYRTRDLNTELAAVKGMLAVAEVRLEVAAKMPALPPEREAALALALREAVTNVVRHAHAASCRVELKQTGAEVRLIVADDGVGKRGPDGAGLKGMRERAEGLGGTLRVAAQGGTRLELTLPVQVVAESESALEAETFVPDPPRLETT